MGASLRERNARPPHARVRGAPDAAGTREVNGSEDLWGSPCDAVKDQAPQ